MTHPRDGHISDELRKIGERMLAVEADIQTTQARRNASLARDDKIRAEQDTKRQVGILRELVSLKDQRDRWLAALASGRESPATIRR